MATRPIVQCAGRRTQRLHKVWPRLLADWLGLVEDLAEQRPDTLDSVQVGAVLRMPLDNMKAMLAQAKEGLLGAETTLMVHDERHLFRNAAAKASSKPIEAVLGNHVPEPVAVHVRCVLVLSLIHI